MPHHHSRLSFLWRPTFLTWAFFYGECLALAMAVAPGIDGPRAVWFGINSLLIQWIIALTLLAIRLLERPLLRLSDRWIARIFLLTLVLTTAVTLLICTFTLPTPLRPPPDQLPFHLGAACALAFLFGLLAIGTIENHLRLQRLATQTSQAQVQALRARIRPHFLFNTLNSAIALVRTDPGRSENLLMDMAELFRTALADTPAIPLAHELELGQRYLAIEKTRFGDRLQLNWQQSPRLPDIDVPPLCLQPLLENAVHHAVEQTSNPTTITTAIDHDSKTLTITVSNALLPSNERRRGHGLGIQAIRGRLSAYHPEARLDTLEQNGQFIARLSLPLVDQVTTR